MKSAALRGFVQSGIIFFLDWIQSSLEYLYVNAKKNIFLPRKKKKRMKSPSEQYWVYKPDSSARERKSIGCEPRREHHRQEWICSVGEDQHLAQTI